MVEVRQPRTASCLRPKGSSPRRIRVRGWLIAALVILAPHAVSAQVLSGSYTGDGANGRAIDGVGFQADVIILKAATAQVGVIRTSTMAGDNSKPMVGGTGLTANLIESITTSGFTIGDDARVNASGTEYYWIAFKSGAKRLFVGSYSGNGTNPRNLTGVGFSPEFVMILPASTTEVMWRSSADTEAFNFATSGGNAAWVSALGADGFTVNSAATNTNGTTYHYAAWNEVDGIMDVGSYTGDNGDPRAIASTAYQPEYVIVKQDGGGDAVQHPASLGKSVDDTLYFSATVGGADRIESLTNTGFTVGNHATTNTTGTYNYVAWRRIVKQTEVLSGSYTGDGLDDRAITGLGFSPDLVIIKGDTAQNAVLRSFHFNGDFTKDLIDATIAGNRIQSLDDEGFTVGTDARVNSDGVTYHWVAWAAGAREMTFGLYTGNGSAGRNITDVGFSPDFVIVVGTSSEAVYRNSAATASFNFDATRDTTWISALGTDGFTVGNNSRVNANGEQYGFIAWNEIAGQFDVGTYSGDGADDRNVTGVGFMPEYLFLQRDTTGFNALHHPASIGASTDSTLFFDGRGAFANYIQALQADGFQVGSQSNVNTNGATYAYAAWKKPTLTAIRMGSATAARTKRGVTVTWKTGYEVDNLGFEVYRELGGERTKVTTKSIAGSALLVPQGFGTVGQSYVWTDDSPQALDRDVSYWIEDIDLNGKRTLHGPIFPVAQKPAKTQSEAGAVGAGQERAAGAPAVEPSPEQTSSEIAPANSRLLEDLTSAPTPREPVAEDVSADATRVRQQNGPVYSGGWIGTVAPAGRPVQAPAPASSSTSSVAPVTRDGSPPAAPQTARPASRAAAPVVTAPRTLAAPSGTASAGGATMTQTVAAPAPGARTTMETQSTSVAQAAPAVPGNMRVRRPALPTSMAGASVSGPAAEVLAQWTLASQAGTRVMVRNAGWYRFSQPVLVAAGINPGVNPKNLRLIVDGVEQPLRYVGNEDDLSFDAGDAIEFFATGVDTPFTDTRAYWIAAGTSPGLRLPSVDATAAGTPAGPSFSHTVERKDRQVFFAALQNGEQENFFGPLIMDGAPTLQDLTLPHVFAGATDGLVEVALQGVTMQPAANDHRVGVLVNGTEVGEMVFDGRNAGVASFPFAHTLLSSGVNTVSFEARGGADDMTLVDYVRITYQREYRADANQLTLHADPGQQLTIAGFTNDAVRVFDITSGPALQELAGTVAPDGGGWAITFSVPAGDQRKLFVTTNDVLGTPAAVDANVASTLNAAGQSGEIVMITDASFASALTPLKSLRESQGYTVQVVDVQDVYDEFSFGQKTPEAIRSFLVRAAAAWAKPPRFVLLVGNATSDPRDHQGLGEIDFVPTRIVSTDILETASDDWFVDADDDGFAELAAIGRLPARTPADASTMVDKIVGYEQSSPEAWHNSVLLVSDQGDSDATEFSALNDGAGGLIPAGYQVNHLKRAEDPTPAATLRTRLTEGAVLVNYQGHGSVDVWRGDLLTAADVATLDNGSRLPLVVAMTCFSGFFHGLFPEESLAEALVREPGGGAIGVWASSGMTDARWQASMDRELLRQMFRGGWLSVGEAMRAAKKVVGNRDVRSTWVFFGDPALRLRGLSRAPVSSTPAVTPVSAPPDPVDGESSLEDQSGARRRAPHAAVRLADFDGDGRGDALFVQPETSSWLSAIGAPGTFQYTSGEFSVAGEPLALDLNNDNRDDLFVYDAQTGNWIQAISTGDGRFITSTGYWAVGLKVVTGDLDGNGRDDLFARNFDGSWFQAFADGDGYYQYRHGAGFGPGQLYAADFNADGLTDVFAYDKHSGQWTMAFSVNGSAPSLTRGTWTPGWQPVVARLNNDNAADLVLWHAESGAWVHGFRDASQFFVYRTGTWTPGGRVHALDLNGDGRDELLRYDWRTGEWTLGTLNGAGGMQQADGLWEHGWEMTPGDLNGDGRLDLFLYNPDTGEWVRRLNLPSGWTDDVSGLWSRNGTVAGRRR
jgi:hypothetical protein